MQVNQRVSGDVLILDVIGDLRLTDEPGPLLRDLVKRQLEEGRRNILLNLSEAEFIDSFGIGEVVASLVSVRKVNGILKICNASRAVNLILNFSRINTLIEVLEDEKSALDSFQA